MFHKYKIEIVDQCQDVKGFIYKGLITIILLSFFSVLGCQKKQQPNIVFVFTDQWRACDTGYAGNDQVKTPNLDRLANEAVVFTNAISNCPVCSPARASIMTGQYPLTHGVFYNDKPLKSDAISIAEILKAKGYQTAYIGKWHINGHENGISMREGRQAPIPRERRQGFDFWRTHECTHDYNNSFYYDEENVKHKWPGYDAIAQTDEAINYIRNNDKNPFVLFLAWGPPHAPYQTAPDKFKKLYNNIDIKLRPNVPVSFSKKAINSLQGYYAHISALDFCMGKLQSAIKEENLDQNTIFVFTSDHGDMLYSQGNQNKQQPWEESIHVPLIIKYPNGTSPTVKKVEKMFSMPDFMPTLLGLCEIPIPESVEGIDFSGELTGREEIDVGCALITCPVPFHQWSYRNGGREYRGIRTERYTYVREIEGPWLLYDNKIDPYQLTNLVNMAAYQNIQNKLDDELKSLLQKRNDDFLTGSEYMKAWRYHWDEIDDSVRIIMNFENFQ